MILIILSMGVGLIFAKKAHDGWRRQYGKGQPAVFVVLPLLLLVAAHFFNQAFAVKLGGFQSSFQVTSSAPIKNGSYIEGVGQVGEMVFKTYSFEYQDGGKWIPYTCYGKDTQVVYEDVQTAQFQRGYTAIIFADGTPQWARYFFFPFPTLWGHSQQITLPDGKG